MNDGSDAGRPRDGLQWLDWMSQSQALKRVREALTCAPGGADGLLFAFLIADLLEEGVYFRERELSYFGIESWGDDLTINCVLGGGELPCLYFVQKKSANTVQPPPKFPRMFFNVVDFVSRTTGAGIGMTLSEQPTQMKPTNDPRTGGRVRYRITAVALHDRGIDKGPSSVYWVERTEAGRPRAHTGGAAILDLFF